MGSGAPRDELLATLATVDPAYPRPGVSATLAAPENGHLLRYVAEDPFGAHVFPGDRPDLPPEQFLDDLDRQLVHTAPFHLWSYIPTCAYRCRFCQYPVVIVKGSGELRDDRASRWVDWNIREAEAWLAAVPHLAAAPVGEFNVFGGTPSLLPDHALRRLLTFYRETFGFTADTTVRVEGDPTTLTPAKLDLLAELGVTKISSGVQSFDDTVLRGCGREHDGEGARRFVRDARRAGFAWISLDLMYGLLDQTVDSVRRDLDVVLEDDVTAVVCTKLHLQDYADSRTGVSGEKPAAWQFPAHRAALERRGHRWPTLGEQYQMREVLTEGLVAAGYREHPTMYFARAGAGAEEWKSIMVDQRRQEAEVAIGLGGSSSCRAGEAIAEVDTGRYVEAVEAGRVPLATATGFSALAREQRAMKMALTTLVPLEDSVHRARFGGRSLFDAPWDAVWDSLAGRGLVTTDRGAGTVTLTPDGRTLVEAVVNSDLGFGGRGGGAAARGADGAAGPDRT